MSFKNIGKKLLAFMLVFAMMAGMTAAFAAETTLEEAKASLATVDITQYYNTRETDNGVHDYRVNGKEVSIQYFATLKMTDIMAGYLQPRQEQLYDAKFNVNVNMDLKLLEFDTNADTLEFTFTSTFLKPRDAANISYALKGYENGIFTYTLSVDRAWAEKQTDGMIIPMELIVYSDYRTVAYGFEEAVQKAPNAKFMYVEKNFTVADWMKEIKLELANMRVKDGVEKTVTTDSRTWKTVYASGTVEGTFSYIKLETPATIGDAAEYVAINYFNTLKFGNDADIKEWKSNVVEVLLKRSKEPTPTPVGPEPESPWLNVEDHFAYIIGMPDGLVHPEGLITRAEVATIFFRMLKDEVRNEYWCKTNDYYDVQPEDWFNNAISTLTNMGIFNGKPDGGFHPRDNITRAEFATIAVRFFANITDSLVITEDYFSDISNSWANEYINMAYLLELVKGYTDGTFKPSNEISRAEAMSIVNNTLRRSPCKEGMLPDEQMIMWPDNMNKNRWFYVVVQEATNSHEFQLFEDGTEDWTKPLPVRDWAAFERAWSDANSAPNPGEVVSGN